MPERYGMTVFRVVSGRLGKIGLGMSKREAEASENTEVMGKTWVELEILNCVKVLEKGETLLYPTDTIWGIGCDATDEQAVSRICRIKERMENKSFILLVSSEEMLSQYVAEVPPTAYDLIRASSDMPLTIIYPKGIHLPRNVVAGDGSVAIRVPRHDFCKEVISHFGKPIVSTSANLSGFAFPLKLADISDTIIERVDHVAIVEENPLTELRPSRIIKLEEDGMFRVVRE